jgi:epoxyqueuosine reductase
MNLCDHIKQLARRCGFIAAGISPPYVNDHYRKRLLLWLQSGYQGTMKWMEKDLEARCDLRQKFPWAKSVLVVADKYSCRQAHPNATIRISRYAWGTDYHLVVKRKLKLLLNSLQHDIPGIVGKIFVDSGPAIEKAFAEQAGLGWIGKNSILIVQNQGSYCFIGIMLLNIPFEYQPGSANICGSCRACLDACPTGAIIAPGMIDARRCISYLTIEKKGDFTESESRLINNWLYGCDICQECCPWNQKWAKHKPDPAYVSLSNYLPKTELEWLSITEAEFKIRFKDSPISRLKYVGFHRNLQALLRK